MCAVLSHPDLSHIESRATAERAPSRKSQCCAGLCGARTCLRLLRAPVANLVRACVRASRVRPSTFISVSLSLLFRAYYAFLAPLLSIFAPSAYPAINRFAELWKLSHSLIPPLFRATRTSPRVFNSFHLYTFFLFFADFKRPEIIGRITI